MPAIPRQRRYDEVMGDREPKVTDKVFVQELQQRLEDKYLTSQCTKEKILAAAEARRVRKLVLDGVINPDDDSRRSQAANGRVQEWTEFWPENPYKSLAEYQEEKKRKSEESNRHDQQEEMTHRSQPDICVDAANSTSSGHANSKADGNPAPHVGRYESSRSPRVDALMTEENLDELYRKASEMVYVMAAPARRDGKAKAKR